MKIIGFVIAPLLFLSVTGYGLIQILFPCDTPLRYHIGSLDTRFNISEDEVRSALRTAEAVWEDRIGRDLFVYDESGSLTVDFVFDERQEKANREASFRETLNEKESTSDAMRESYEELTERYRALTERYEDRAGAYERRLRAYNEEVSDWNGRNGAPADVFERLTRTKNELENEERVLMQQEKELRLLADKINTIGKEGNEAIEDYNALVHEYNSTYGDGGEFTQGEYGNGRISIFEFGTTDELSIVLAHEMGHALGLDHVAGSSSIMYQTMGAQSLGIGLSTTDIEAFYGRCGSGQNDPRVLFGRFMDGVRVWASLRAD